MTSDGPPQEQLALVRGPVKRRAPAATIEELAPEAPVARVVVDVALAHLDRSFDYAVPASMSEAAVPGARVRVRFSGRLVNGFVLERLAITDHGEVATLLRLQRVVSAESVLSPEIAALARAVADRYAGPLADVLRLAIPPRHARVESEAVARDAAASVRATRDRDAGLAAWTGHPGAAGFLDALARGEAPRAVWTAPPGGDTAHALAAAVGATLAADRGALIVVPDLRDLAALTPALEATCTPASWVVLTADLGPAERYRRWLSIRRGRARIVVGTRSAMFAPVARLGLAVVWDDGDDLHSEPRAPYPHVREVLALRSYLESAALLIAGHARTAEAARLVATGWARAIDPDRSRVRATAPRVRTVGDDADLARDAAARTARLPSVAWEVAREALGSGPVLVQVPRRGYAPSLACARCREPARCLHCAGPFESATADRAACSWCGRPSVAWVCATCGGTRFRASAIGSRRTAEELARAFPKVTVRTSGRDGILVSVPAKSALVVATPGAEPYVEGGAGYAAALLLDGDRLVARPDLRAGEEALRRWLNASVLVRSADGGGIVVIVADPSLTPVQALVRWDPIGFAERELAERVTLHLPPAARVAALSGPASAVAEFVALVTLPPGAEVLGPTAVEPQRRPPTGDGFDAVPLVRTLIRVPVIEGGALTEALRAVSGVRSARKESAHVQVMVDPVALG